jgi:hypothetical protein
MPVRSEERRGWALEWSVVGGMKFSSIIVDLRATVVVVIEVRFN